MPVGSSPSRPRSQLPAALDSDVHHNHLKYDKRAVREKTAPNRSIEHLASFCC